MRISRKSETGLGISLLFVFCWKRSRHCETIRVHSLITSKVVTLFYKGLLLLVEFHIHFFGYDR